MEKTQSAPGVVSLIGSGETANAGGQVLELLAQQYSTPVKISVLETPAGFEANAGRVAGRVAEYMATRLRNYQPRITQVQARKKGTPLSPDHEEIVRPLYESQVIFFGPGSPTYTVRQLQNSLAWQVIQARHRLGTSLALASAATIAVGALALPVYEIYKVGEDPHWKPGLDLFGPYGLRLVIVPHWNNQDGGAELDTSRCFLGMERFSALCEQIPDEMTIVGIDEHTGLVIDFAEQSCRVMGQGQAHRLRRGAGGMEEETYPSGTRFPIQALGDYHALADGMEGLPEGVWNKAQAGLAAVEDSKAVPQEVQQLVAERQEARGRGDWALADQIRGEIARMGWEVQDTAGGPVIHHS
jgi:cyanophycinase-like exopeptidase